MKISSRGPFARIRWYCNDGSVLPPKPYACSNRGGGVQHGEWNERTKRLRAGGYKVANILADLNIDPIVNARGYSDSFNQILIEQFLIAADDGWILKKARYYRGALQAEDETAGARRLLLGLTSKDDWTTRGFVPLLQGARLLAHGVETSTIAEVRQHSLALSKKDKDFMSIRVKIHNKPDVGDANLVREYAQKVSDPELAAEYERLAANIDKIYTSESIIRILGNLTNKLSGNRKFTESLKAGTETLATNTDPSTRFAATGQLLAKLRDNLPLITSASTRLIVVDANLALQVENYAAATMLSRNIANTTRQQRLQWLGHSLNAVYGAGLISARQLIALRDSLNRLKKEQIKVSTYKDGLDYLAQVPGWGNQWMRFHFYESMQKLALIEPLANLFIQDLLRSSPLFFYAKVLDSLLRDANQLVGVKRELFGKEVGAGLRNLNPGLSRGTLYLKPGDAVEDFDSEGIYLLPETTADLPPVAGILTAGEGNPLSHVQLLARNLGIPNVVINEALVPQLRPYEGKKVILAVSPAGSVRIAIDRGQLDHLFKKEALESQILIHADLKKLDLKTQDITPLSRLRASDSGRIVGPKAANLGELRYHYPEAVAEGLTIPFGVFRELLEQPSPEVNQTLFQWAQNQYAKLNPMKPDSQQRKQATEKFRIQFEQQILSANPGKKFRQRLQTKMDQEFGKNGTYGVFVRSDTNVEDLPGFTGAGLNKTVPNVVGFDKVVAAISEVWASPFSERAFAWRQAHMDNPIHVYPAVLLLRTIPSEKSGVMVTQDIDTGNPNWLSVVANEGVGGGVEGQAAERLRINVRTGEVRLLAQATTPWQYVPSTAGGVIKSRVSNDDSVLKPEEIRQLIKFARELPRRFPAIKDANGNPAPADIEFGFIEGELKLFQIRPFLESAKAQSSVYLNSLDEGMSTQRTKIINMTEVPSRSL